MSDHAAFRFGELSTCIQSWQAENWRREEGGFLFKQEEVRRSLGWAQMGLVKMAARSWEEK